MANPFDDDFDDSHNEIIGSYAKPTRRDDGGISFIEQQIEDALQRSLASTGRSIAALQESEEIGINTAQDLIAQGEKLQNVDQRLSSIQETTKQTQRHLNSVKSVFGSIRNYFNKDKACPQALAAAADHLVKPAPKARESRLAATVERINNDAYDTTPSYGLANRSTLPEATVQSIAGSRWGAMNDEIEDNLGEMEKNLLRLKELGLGLNDELVQQNEVIDSVARKAEKANITVDNQNRQMRRLLGNDKAKKKMALPGVGGGGGGGDAGQKGMR